MQWLEIRDINFISRLHVQDETVGAPHAVCQAVSFTSGGSLTLARGVTSLVSLARLSAGIMDSPDRIAC
eukprot:m.156296 g.156296  ORF g.156296 m.156296 type:complete len:69 (+) comp16438_c0_seq4:1740-1946(+)